MGIFNGMRKTIKLVLIVLISVIRTATFAQAELNDTFLSNQNKDSISYTLVENQFKLYASEIDLHTLKIISLDNVSKNLPDIIMPTSHANLYAIIDFSKCIKGVYVINGFKEQEEKSIIIIFEKNEKE